MNAFSTRRRLLAALPVAGVASVAGCLTDGGDSDGETDTDRADDDGDGSGTTDATGAEDETGTDDATGTGDVTGTDDDAGTGDETGTTDESSRSDGGSTSADDLDLREANVVGVESTSGGDGTRFSVTLIHDDGGEDGYANWWAVETRDGEELGRRDLAHAHGTQEFTRSTTVSIPDDVECVVVRGHDQTHEYGGQAALVSVASGATRFVKQGREPASFATADCP
jgi:hypothetical protein